MEKANIETRVAETILQQGDEIAVGGKTYKTAPPSTATLILASEAVSHLPHVKLNADNLAVESLNIAKNCRGIGDVAAILILGAKSLIEEVKTRQTTRKRRLWGILPDKVVETEVVATHNRKAELAKALLEEMSPRELNALLLRLLGRMELADFFGLTTFLTEINLIRPTKVETEATQSGR